jgi:Fe-S cluster assembly protein SufB
MPAVQETIERVRRIDLDQYKYGFVTDIESDKAPVFGAFRTKTGNVR